MKADRYVVDSSRAVRLDDYDPDDTGKFKSREDADRKLQDDIETLAQLQDKIYAHARYGILVVLQGMDTAGKDGVIKHVMTGLNPAGVIVYSFKQPSDEERRHDYLWRVHKTMPERGRMSILNRSYYEDVVVTRVHPQLLGEFAEREQKQGEDFWKARFRDIVSFERYLAENNILVLKFFLHISKEEQKKRLLKRLDDPSKHWKFSESDLQERGYWEKYVHAYEDVLNRTSSAAPWYVIPANHKWFARLAIADIIVDRLKQLHPEYPKVSGAIEKLLEKAKAEIESEP